MFAVISGVMYSPLLLRTSFDRYSGIQMKIIRKASIKCHFEVIHHVLSTFNSPLINQRTTVTQFYSCWESSPVYIHSTPTRTRARDRRLGVEHLSHCATTEALIGLLISHPLVANFHGRGTLAHINRLLPADDFLPDGLNTTQAASMTYKAWLFYLFIISIFYSKIHKRRLM